MHLPTLYQSKGAVMSYRSTLLLCTTVLLSLGAFLPTTVSAQTAQDIIGTWTNVSNVLVRSDGSKTDLFGPHGTGMAVFESNGRYMIINVNPDVPKFAANSRTQGTTEENKAAVGGNIAHYGTYTLTDKVLTLKIEGSCIQTGF